MAAIANLVINDGAATPVAHTLAPVQSGLNTFWRDTISNLALVGQVGVRLIAKPDNGSGLNKLKMIVEVPSLEVITGTSTQSGYQAPPKVAFSNKVVLDFILPSRGTNQNRVDLHALTVAALQNQQVKDAITGPANPY